MIGIPNRRQQRGRNRVQLAGRIELPPAPSPHGILYPRLRFRVGEEEDTSGGINKIILALYVQPTVVIPGTVQHSKEDGRDLLANRLKGLQIQILHASEQTQRHFVILHDGAQMGHAFFKAADLIIDIRHVALRIPVQAVIRGLIESGEQFTAVPLYAWDNRMAGKMAVWLKQAGKEDQLTQVLEEVPRVREDSGYPPLVTPTSQIVGTQAVFNVIMGERYKMCTNEFKDLVAGKYGTTPMPIDPEFRKRIIGDMKPIDCRPADLLEPELEKLRAEIPQYIEQEEDVLSYAQFPKVAIDFFEKRRNKKLGINSALLDKENKVHPV